MRPTLIVAPDLPGTGRRTMDTRRASPIPRSAARIGPMGARPAHGTGQSADGRPRGGTARPLRGRDGERVHSDWRLLPADRLSHRDLWPCFRGHRRSVQRTFLHSSVEPFPYLGEDVDYSPTPVVPVGHRATDTEIGW
jgi:hypothetical protein